MMVLPRGKPVKEGVNPIGMDWREVLEKLHDGHFSGYLRVIATAESGLLLFLRGQLTTIRYRCGTTELTGEEALHRIFSVSLSRQARLDIYRLEPDLAALLHNLIEGTPRYEGQYRELLDIPHLIDMLKRELFCGGLRVRAGNEVAVIFMHEGVFLGFFLDGQSGLATDVDLSASVAWRPGARIDVVCSAGLPEPILPDLLDEIDLIALWDRALLSHTQID